ncbi:MAG: FprA family A-type flavoprotein [Candidatus Aminicenantes bacterium]|nr:FprA family A-type flavoprotein [Acidobacteriota bacterium]MCG2811584.1 FprA family A-type flavoprotein [Candidatus Aminicenantes bacterium]
MAAIEIKKNIAWVGALDWDRRLFDELIPLPEGTSYNAYLVRGGEKTALIDTVDPDKTGDLLENLQEAGVTRIDYIVSQHAEQDHSGSIGAILEIFPQAVVVTNEKCKAMLMDLLQIPENKFQTVGDGQTLDLGGKTLEFIFAPWVHWPETMLTYLREDKILFSCDFLGSHLAQSRPLLTDENRTYQAAKRYFAEIMMPFRLQIRKHLERLNGLALDLIAPSHGVVYPRPAFILDAYRDWVSDKTENLVLIPFVSMHGSTREMVEHLTGALIRQNITVMPCNMIHTDIGELAKELVDASTVVMASPTVLGGAHPVIANTAFLANALRPKLKFASIIGSYGWGGRLVENLLASLGNLKVELLDPVLAKGCPSEKDYQALDNLAAAIAAKHRGIGVLP